MDARLMDRRTSPQYRIRILCFRTKSACRINCFRIFRGGGRRRGEASPRGERLARRKRPQWAILPGSRRFGRPGHAASISAGFETVACRLLKQKKPIGEATENLAKYERPIERRSL